MRFLDQPISNDDLKTLEEISHHILDGTFASWVRSMSSIELEKTRRVFMLARTASIKMQDETMLEMIKLKAIEAEENLDVSEAKEYLKKFQLNPS